jgi:hypothetical protein
VKLIVLPVLDEISDRDNVAEFTRVPRNTSHSVPFSAQNQLVSPLLVREDAMDTHPAAGPVSVRFPVPVELVVSLQRSITLCVMLVQPG